MKRGVKVYDDPVVAEVRRIRAMLWKQAGGTVEGYLALNRRSTGARTAGTRLPSKTKPRTRRKAG